MKNTFRLSIMLLPALLLSGFGFSACSSNNLMQETFQVVRPSAAQVKEEGTVIPRIEDASGNRFEMPNARYYLRNGTEVDVSYLGIGNYTLDVSFVSKGEGVLEGVNKVTVNQTHEEVAPYRYYRGVVHEWGVYRYFTIEDSRTSSFKGYYCDGNKNNVKRNEGDIVMAGISGGEMFSRGISYVLTDDEGNVLGASPWDYGPVIW